MSLQDLTRCRLSGRVPPTVWVIVGDKPKTAVEGPGFVTISPTDDVRRMDLRALTGLRVDLFELGDHPNLCLAAMDAMHAAGARLIGVSDAFGQDGMNDRHVAVLRRGMELLCT